MELEKMIYICPYNSTVSANVWNSDGCTYPEGDTGEGVHFH